MFALMALPPFSFEGEQDEGIDDDGPMLRELSDLPLALVQAMQPTVGSILREDYSQTAGMSYWMNHCEHCDSKQGDHFVHGPNGPFWPNDDAEMQAIEAFESPRVLRRPQPLRRWSHEQVEQVLT